MSERLMRLVTAGGAAVFLACALPAVAGATDYCVDPVTTCATGNNYQHLEDALAKADDATDADRVLLGAGKYPAPSVDGFVYEASGSPVEIVGAGAGQTILTGPVGAHRVLRLSGGAGTSVSDLTIKAPQDVSFGFWGVWTDGVAKRIEVIEEPGQTKGGRAGVYLDNGGRLEDSTVKLGPGASGVFLAGGHVDRSALTAETGATSNNGSIEHSRVTGYYFGVRAYGGATSIAGSRIYAGEDFGIHAESYAGVPKTTVDADSVTIVGPGVGKGVFASTDYDTGWSAGINLTNSVIRGFATALAASAPGSGQATVAASYSDYDPNGNKTAGGTNASISEANVSNVGDAGFADAANGDYHLVAGSPLVDAGDPASAQGLDLDGNPLVADGDGDGSARRDIGAFELPAVAVAAPGAPAAPAAPDTKAPVITGFRTTPSLFAIGRASTPLAARTPRGTRFRYMLSEKARVTLRIQRRLAGRRARYRTVGVLSRSASSGANSTRFSGRLRKRALRPGRYRVRIVATDAAGNCSAPRTTSFRIARS
jgi:hypothetical protein